MRRLLAATGVVVLAVGGYATADAYDRAPGILTLDDPAPVVREEPAQDPPADAALPGLVGSTDPSQVLPVLQPDAPVPTRDGLARALADDLGDRRLGGRVGVVVTDGLTGDVLYDRDAGRPQLPASTQKILSAAAVAQRADLSRTLTTTVVRGERPDELVLVAGGDTMLAKGAGDEALVEGRAGLKDLATQVADALGDEAGGEGGDGFTLRLDATFAEGPRYPSTWDQADVAGGFTQAVTTIGLAGQRPEPYEPSPRYPERSALAALATQLRRAGVEVDVETDPASWREAAPAEAEQLGVVRSAPVGQVLELALASSDNALTELVTRLAAHDDGVATDFGSVTRWVTDTLAGAGVDTTGVRLVDASGLSRGQRATATSISQTMALGLGEDPTGMRALVAELPVAGVSGTLHDRFTAPEARPAAGVARAKTGTLTGISSLAGTTVSADGRLLTYVVVADKVPSSTGTLGARAVLDRSAATLTTCGCR